MTDAAVPAAGPLPKGDPETFELRARPRPVVRFRRGVVIGITAAASLVVIGVASLALRSPRSTVQSDRQISLPTRTASPDALESAPRSYGEVPQLGPPLPGDLGRAIVARQRRADELELGATRDPVAAQSAAAVDTERQRRAAELQSVRGSSVMMQLSSVDRVAAGREQVSIPPVLGSEATGAAAPASSAAQRKVDFARSAPGDTVAGAIKPAVSPWILSAGTVIPASLVTGLNSDLPGLAVAQVTQDVRDSPTGTAVLVPRGARLIGRYDNAVDFGQRRALLVWSRIVFPDGASVDLDSMPATDPSGYAGLEDRVDFHSWQLLKGIGLATLLGVGTELSLGSDESDLVEALREATQQNATRAGDRITQRNLDIQPTLIVRPGSPVRAIVHKDLVLRPWRG